MASPKKPKSSFIPDLLPAHTLIDVIKIATDGTAEKREMEYGVYKGMKKQKGFIYRAYQKNVAQFVLKK